MNRLKLLLILATMPDEAFGWFVLWASAGSDKGAGTKIFDQARQIFPDGLGGFAPESRTAIDDLRKEAKKFMGAQ